MPEITEPQFRRRPGRGRHASRSVGAVLSRQVPDEHQVRYTSPLTEIVPGITADPEHAFGKPVIAGTRVPGATVLGLLAAGRSEAEILAEYDLTTEQIRAVFRYAAWLAL
ncbi:MAG TPA: DUF433 domain-containing protein [Kofleriaceae bacterium]